MTNVYFIAFLVLSATSFTIWHLRTSYLSDIKDGIGERLINVNSSILNTAPFRAAGWVTGQTSNDDANSEDEAFGNGVTRCYSPPIPTTTRVASKYLHAGNRTERKSLDTVQASGGKSKFDGNEEEDEEEEEEEEDDEADGAFHGLDDEVEEEEEEEDDFGPEDESDVATEDNASEAHGIHDELDTAMNLDGLVVGSADSALSSELSGDTGRSGTAISDEDDLRELRPQPLRIPKLVTDTTAAQNQKLSVKINDSSISDDLPTPRPVSTAKPISLLAAALQAQEGGPSNPMDKFAKFFGKAATTTEPPLYIKIYYPTSKASAKSYEMPILRTIKRSEEDVPVTVADTIGTALWLYGEEHVEPPMERDFLNVTKWCLRMIEDEEVDYDFPPLPMTRPIADFTSNNNRAAASRGRSRSKPFDEFALVKASEPEVKQNEKLLPDAANDVAEKKDTASTNTLAVPSQPVAVNNEKSTTSRNHILGQPFSSAIYDASLTPADLPAVSTTQATPRMGPSKKLKVRFVDREGMAQLTTINTTTDSYIAEILDTVCRKWALEKALYVLKVSNSNTIAPLDRTVEALVDRVELDLVRRRFGSGPLAMTGSPGSASPNAPLHIEMQSNTSHSNLKKAKKIQQKGAHLFGTSSNNPAHRMLHPLAYQLQAPPDTTSRSTGGLNGIPGVGSVPGVSSSGFQRRYNVTRKQPMSFNSSNQKVLAFDGDYMRIMSADNTAAGTGGGGGKLLFDSSNAKTRLISFNDIVGSKISRRHPKSFRIVVLKGNDANAQKRYDFEAKSAAETAEIVDEINRNMKQFHV